MKPTTLMLVRLPWLRCQIQALGRVGRCPHPKGTHISLKGRDSAGHFRTSIAKIYPAAMNAAIAHALAVFVQQTFVGHAPPPEAVETELAALNRLDFVSKDVVQPDVYFE